jgi:hypothetical protein
MSCIVSVEWSLRLGFKIEVATQGRYQSLDASTDSVGPTVWGRDAHEKNELDIVRRAFAKQITAAAGVRDERVEPAFAAVTRKDLLGPGPWPIVRRLRGYARQATIQSISTPTM